jgi:hypothetical protein
MACPPLLSLGLLVGAQLPLHAALAGVPLPPRPGPMPGSWLGWANDALGGEVGQNLDDFRTNAFSGGITIDQRWIVAADLSSLTNKQISPENDPSRSDELTVSLGRIIARREDAHFNFLASTGIGFRHAGDLGGSSVQNEWHRAIEFPKVELPYDDNGTAATFWLAGQYIWLSDTEAPFGDGVFRDGSRIGLSLDLSNLISTIGEMQMEVGVNFLWTGHDSVIWTGLRQQFRNNEALTPTAELIAEEEAGLWYAYGLSVAAWSFEGAIQLDSGLSYGRIGWMFDRPPIHNRLGRDVFHAEIGGTLNSYGLGGQVRWQPRWLRDFRPLGDRSMLLIDYRFGRVPGADFTDTSIRYQQGLLGWDVSAFKPRDSLMVNPFLYGGFGWRFEDTRHEGDAPEFAEVSQDGAVIQGGGGLRITWGDRPHRGRGIQYGISATYDRWVGFDQQEIAASGNPERRFTLLGDNETLSLRLAIAVGW